MISAFCIPAPAVGTAVTLTDTNGDGLGVTDTGMVVGAADGDEGTVVTLTCAYATIKPDATSVTPNTINDSTTNMLL
jgi:hypothetical protein